MIKKFQNSTELILEELKIIDNMLRHRINKVTEDLPDEEVINELSGLFISNNHAKSAIQEIKKIKNDRNFKGYDNTSFNNLLFKEIESRWAESEKEGIFLTFPHLVTSFSLSNLEQRILLICLAPQIDSLYGKIYAFLQNDITKKNPTIGLILDLLGGSLKEKMEFWNFFSRDSILFKSGLIELENSDNNKSISLYDSVLVNEHIRNFLLEHETIDPTVRDFLKLIFVNKLDTTFHEKERNRIINIIDQNWKKHKVVPIFNICGEAGSGRQGLVESVCRQLNIPLLEFNFKNYENFSNNYQEVFRKVERNAHLWNAAICISGIENHSDKAYTEKIAYFLRMLRQSQFTPTIFLVTNNNSKSSLRDFDDIIDINISIQNFSERYKIWNSHLASVLSQKSLHDLANKFKLTKGQIEKAIKYAQNLASANNQEFSKISLDDLYEGCKIQSGKILSRHSSKVNPRYTWQDIILPHDKKTLLGEIVNYVKYKNKVFFDWGFTNKHSLKTGLNILFAGESGTGKTMAAEIIANELHYDLYKINLSTIVSKYIGETEKNLDEIFKEAENSNAILFFDEADALFGKRSEVTSAHDRYANIEVGHLLQKLEGHQEIVILASNLPKNIDSAFARRMQFWLNFPFPDEHQRFLIWKNIFPSKTPLASDIDFEFLANKFRISGGNIKNIAISSAILAAKDSSSIKMSHIIHSIKREYEKMRKPLSESEFGQYSYLFENIR